MAMQQCKMHKNTRSLAMTSGGLAVRLCIQTFAGHTILSVRESGPYERRRRGGVGYVRMACTLLLCPARRGVWSIAPGKRAWRGDNDIYLANSSEYLLPRTLVAPLSRASIIFSSVNTE